MRRCVPLLLSVACAVEDPGTRLDTDVAGPDALCADNPWYPDVDGDGYGDDARLVRQCDAPQPDWIPRGGDCDDTTRARGPEVAEAPNTLDDDCDGTADEGTVRFDDDGDGACEEAPCTDGARPGDCNDADPLVAPGATERCNGVDDDCDRVVPTVELDGDGDGFIACTECDDRRDTVFPGAAELCNNRDDDCNQVADDVDVDGDGATACPTGFGLDVLVVLDTSCSMTSSQAALAREADVLLDALEAVDAAWRVGVLASDDAAALVAPPIEPNTTDDRAAFQAAVTPTTRVSGGERPLPTALAFLRSGAGASFRRPGAALAVLIVADEDDKSRADIADALASLQGSLPDEAFALGVIGGGWTGCANASRSGEPTPRLQRLAELAGAPTALVCDGGWLRAWGTDWLPAAPVDCDDEDERVHAFATERCNGLDDDCDTLVDEDHDGDGASACARDCDDRDARRGPDLPELCDGRDNDCAGGLDDVERDADGDGWTPCAGDCEDADATRHPYAVESCGDGVDQDCDGLDRPTGDADGDGYSICAGDCDDADPATFPWSLEDPFSGRDEDCDGLVDGLDPDLLTAVPALGDTSLVRLSDRGTLFTLCGLPYTEATASVDGFLLAGNRSLSDATPSAAGLRAHAPMVAAAWTDLDGTGWGGGRFLPEHGARGPMWIVRRSGSLTVVWDEVPRADGSGPLSAVLTVGDELVEAALLGVPGALRPMMGFSCDGAEGPVLDAASGPMCTDLDGTATALVGASAWPARLSAPCQP